MTLIWISQTALRIADTDFFAQIVVGAIFMFFFLYFKSHEDGGVLGVLQYLIAGFLYFWSLYSIWNNNNTQDEDESRIANPKKENKKKKANPPPVLADDNKRKNKKCKRSPKKAVCKENKELTTLKEKTKMYPSLDVCKVYNRSARDMYDQLYRFRLTEGEMRKNNYPMEEYQPRTLVADDISTRLCVRCNEEFEIFRGVYLAATKCQHHPRKATFRLGSQNKLHACCDLPIGAPGCTISNRHVTLQHGPKPLTKTASRRHIRKDLQHRVFGLDCEMSYTTAGLEVTRIGLVDIDGLTVYGSYVKPKNTILDFNTIYSGVEKRHLENITITIDNVIDILNSYIHEDTILVGHALNNDLAALGLIHKTVIDTSVLYPDPNHPNNKRSLKSLASEFLHKSVQDDPAGHDCIEDARTSLQLALLKVPHNPSSSVVPRPLCQTEYIAAEQPVEEAKTHVQQHPLLEITNIKLNYLPVHLHDFSKAPKYAMMSYNASNPEDYRMQVDLGYLRRSKHQFRYPEGFQLL